MPCSLSPGSVATVLTPTRAPASCELPRCILLSVAGGVESPWVVDNLHGHGGGYLKVGRDENVEDQN